MLVNDERREDDVASVVPAIGAIGDAVKFLNSSRSANITSKLSKASALMLLYDALTQFESEFVGDELLDTCIQLAGAIKRMDTSTCAIEHFDCLWRVMFDHSGSEGTPYNFNEPKHENEESFAGDRVVWYDSNIPHADESCDPTDITSRRWGLYAYRTGWSENERREERFVISSSITDDKFEVCLKQMVANCADVNRCIYDLRPPLHYAIESGRSDAVIWSLIRIGGAHLQAKDCCGFTALDALRGSGRSLLRASLWRDQRYQLPQQDKQVAVVAHGDNSDSRSRELGNRDASPLTSVPTVFGVSPPMLIYQTKRSGVISDSVAVELMAIERLYEHFRCEGQSIPADTSPGSKKRTAWVPPSWVLHIHRMLLWDRILEDMRDNAFPSPTLSLVTNGIASTEFCCRHRLPGLVDPNDVSTMEAVVMRMKVLCSGVIDSSEQHDAAGQRFASAGLNAEMVGTDARKELVASADGQQFVQLLRSVVQSIVGAEGVFRALSVDRDTSDNYDKNTEDDSRVVPAGSIDHDVLLDVMRAEEPNRPPPVMDEETGIISTDEGDSQFEERCLAIAREITFQRRLSAWSTGKSILMLAVEKFVYPHLLISLLRHGADPNFRHSSSGATALHIAAAAADTMACHILLDARATIDALDKWKASPLHYCGYRQAKHAYCIRALLARGAKSCVKVNIDKPPSTVHSNPCKHIGTKALRYSAQIEERFVGYCTTFSLEIEPLPESRKYLLKKSMILVTAAELELALEYHIKSNINMASLQNQLWSDISAFCKAFHGSMASGIKWVGGKVHRSEHCATGASSGDDTMHFLVEFGRVTKLLVSLSYGTGGWDESAPYDWM